MNNRLIAKVINTNDANACPEFTYENPLIDRNVAGALARSFVKILSTSQQNSNINTNLRRSVLANIRKLCRIEPENHIDIDEKYTKSLTEVYLDDMRNSQRTEATTSVERELDNFLVRKMKEVDINSNLQCSLNPEVRQALLNLDVNNSNVEFISQDLLQWNMSDKKNLALVKNLWANTSLGNSVSICDISLKVRAELEIMLLNFCHRLLTEPNLKTDDLFSDITLKDLVKKCSISPECFQICTCVLNYLLITTNYNLDIKIFVSQLIENVKLNCSNSISVLYPSHLSFIVVLLDIELDTLPQAIRNKYMEQTLIHLKRLQNQSHSELVLLLSHFPDWFPIYSEK